MGVQVKYEICCDKCPNMNTVEAVRDIKKFLDKYEWSYSIQGMKPSPEFWQYINVLCPDCIERGL